MHGDRMAADGDVGDVLGKRDAVEGCVGLDATTPDLGVKRRLEAILVA
jgi:hypothetical protein